MSLSRIRRRFVTTIPKALRKKALVEVGDSALWIPLGEREFLTVLLPANRYKALAELIGEVKLSRKAREEAAKVYLEAAGAKAQDASG